MAKNWTQHRHATGATACPECGKRLTRLMENGLSPDSAAAAVSIDDTMWSIRRAMVRRELLRQAIVDLELDVDEADLLVVHAIHACLHTNDEVTVGLVAEHLDIDPSRASRMVAETVEKGLTRRFASQADARRICLELTDRARAYEGAIHAYKAAIFSDAMGTWDEQKLVEFSRSLEKYSQWYVDRDPDFSQDKRIVAIKKQLKTAK